MTAFTETVNTQTTGVTRSFDGANRLEYAVDASGTTTYTYNANGNLVELLPAGAADAWQWATVGRARRSTRSTPTRRPAPTPSR